MASLKEESPAGTGISDVPVFSAPHESAKSTPVSTFSNGSHRPKDEADGCLMPPHSAAAATVASAAVPSDDMPSSPYSFATTPPSSSQAAPIESDATSFSEPASTPAEAAAHSALLFTEKPTPTTNATEPLHENDMATTAADELSRAASPEARHEIPVPAMERGEDSADPIPAPEVQPAASAERMSLDEPAETAPKPEPAQSAEPANSDDHGSDVNDGDVSTNATPSRRSRRISSRISTAASQPSTSADNTPAHRPQRMARLSRQSLPAPDTAAKEGATSASKYTAKSARKAADSLAKPKVKQATSVERRATRQSNIHLDSPSLPSPLGKRGRRGSLPSKLPRELSRLQDTKEFSHVDDNPVIYTVWSNGKFVPANAAGEPLEKPSTRTAKSGRDDTADGPQHKKTRTGAESADSDDSEDAEPAALKPPHRIVKKWLDKGLYAGQSMPSNPTLGLNIYEKKALAKLPELTKQYKPNNTLPMPIFNGLRLLIQGRDFKIPYDVFNPLPPGQPKPVKYGKFSKNRFVGEAHAIWRKNPHFDDFPSKCVCKPETGCDEDCQNRIMLYECDDTNCNVGADKCRNREFQRLAERTASKNLYHVGVEVFKTPDRGHGIRASRCFRPGQIIMEYIGEIITEEESDRRMNELYKNNACYYLMSFDQSLIIDGTRGSIARFVNHSCSPNCRMIKWIVSGQPRIGLFAGDRPIMTGEELTYDYNFDPYSSKNVQKCLCGSVNCRGFLGPRKSEKAVSKAAAEKAAAEKAKLQSKGARGKNTAGPAGKRGKRKLNEDDDESTVDGPAAKKARLSSAASRGPGRPRKDEEVTKPKPSVKTVTTTKAALAALAANSAKDARAVRAARAARAAKKPGSASTSKAVKAIKAVKGVRVRAGKTAKPVKTMTKLAKAKTKATTAAKSKAAPRAKAATAEKATQSPHVKFVKRAAVKGTTSTKAAKSAQAQKAKAAESTKKATPSNIDIMESGAASQATPMARAVAKAARKAASAAKAAKTAKTVTKMKPKTPLAKRATAMATVAAKRAGKAKAAVVKKTTEPTKTAGRATAKAAAKMAGRAAGKAAITTAVVAADKPTACLSVEEGAASARVTAEVTAEVAGRGGSSSTSMIQQKLNFPVISTPRQKKGWRSPATSPSTKRVAKTPYKPTGRPIGRPPGSAKKREAEKREAEGREAEKPSTAIEEAAGEPGGVVQEQQQRPAMTPPPPAGGDLMVVDTESAEDVIHVASSVFAAVAA